MQTLPAGDAHRPVLTPLAVLRRAQLWILARKYLPCALWKRPAGAAVRRDSAAFLADVEAAAQAPPPPRAELPKARSIPDMAAAPSSEAKLSEHGLALAELEGSSVLRASSEASARLSGRHGWRHRT